MALGSKALQSIDDEDEDDNSTEPDQKAKPSGPPPAQPKPRSASDSSLFSTAGKAASEDSKAGLGSEGSDPSIIGMQGLTLIQRGVQMLNLAFPDNPGLPAVLGDLMGRLQSIIPQLVAGSSNGAGMGLFGAAMGGPMQPGPPTGMPMGMPPGMGAPMGMPPAPMAGGPPGAPPPGGQPMPPQQPPIPPR